MKTSHSAPLFLVAVALAAGLNVAYAQSTDGKVTYSVKTLNYSATYSPNNVCAVWVVDGSGKFVKTLCRHANARINYLSKWITDRGTYTTVDGVTGATLTSQPQTHTVIWNCRGTNGLVAADGTYTFRAEYTSSNGQGPYMASSCQFAKGTSAFTTNFLAYSNAGGVFTNMTLTYTPYNEVAVSGLSPSSGLINSAVPIVVTLTNQTFNTLPFSVVVSNLTSGTLIGSLSSAAFAARSVTNLTFSWSTAGLAANSYQVQAVVAKLATETNTANNVLTSAVALASPEAGDIAVFTPTPTNGISGAVIPLLVRVTNVTANATGPFSVSLVNLTADNIFEKEATARVRASEDDAEEAISTHATTLNSTDLELVIDGTSQQVVGVRFRGLPVPNSAAITSAFIQFFGRAGQLLNSNPISLTLRGQAADDPPAFAATQNDISGRADSSASVAWSPADWVDGEAGLSAQTPDLAPVVQELVSRAGWTSGNAMVFKISGSGSRRAWAYDGNTNLTAQLVVRWAERSPLIGSTQTVSLAGGAATNLTFEWNTAGLPAGSYQILTQAGPLGNEVNTADNTLTNAFTLRQPIRDLAIRSVQVTPLVPPNVVSNIIVVVTNQGDFAEGATVSLTDVTATPLLIGSLVTNLLPQAGLRVAVPWNTAGVPLGAHTLEAVVQPLAGEAHADDNTQRVYVVVASGMATNSLTARSALWKYYDKGLDITGAPWTTADYYDGFWASGASPLGYTLTNIATVISTGGVATNRHTTTYFRREFTMDFAPMALTARVMRADGIVLYLNGKEIARQNLPDGAIGYATLASGAVTGTNAYRYYDFPIAASDLVVGRNLLAAELHLSAPNREAAGFSMELLSVNPAMPPAPALTPSALTPDGSAQSGDAAGVSVTIANTGNVTASGLALIRDAATGQVLGSLAVGPLAPGETVTVRLVLSTFGAATGSRTLQALTVINGVTNTATVATAAFTLEAPSFSPRLVDAAGSIGGRCNAVVASGSTVYLGCGSTLEAWDVQSPAAPVRKAAVRLPGIVEDLAASNGWVYAATGVSGVQIVQAASATQLVHRASYDTTGYARRLSLAGSRLYIADVLGGVRALDVTAPASPSLAGAYATTGPAQALAAVPPRLLVLDGQRGLLNLHAASPSALALTGAYSRVTAGLAVSPVSGAAFVADANARLIRVSTAAPTNLTAVTNALLPGAAQSLAASGPALYAAAGAQGLLTLDATTLALQSAFDVGGDAADVAAAGSTLYVAAGFGGALAFDIASPLAPQPLALFPTGARPVDAAACGSVLYVAADEGGLQLHRLEQLGLPKRLGVLPGIANARCVAVAPPLLLVAEGLSGLKVFDITDPVSPLLRGSYAASELSHIRRLAVAGNRAALTDGSKILLLSVSNPSAPAPLATLAPGGFVFDLAAVPGEVYAACGGAGLKALRMDSLGVDSTLLTPGPATAVTLSSNLLTVACGPAGWLTLNIDNAASPVQVTATPGIFAFDAASSGKLLSLGDGVSVADVINLSAPLSPVLSNSFANLTSAMRVRAVSGLVLSAEDEAGLAILNASPGDINLNGVPDEWEQQIVSASSQTNGPIRSVLDVDLQTVGPNGFTYYQSYLAGLTPTDPKSVLAISAVQPLAGPGNQIAVSWQSVAGKRYTLYKSTDLASGFAPVPAATGLTATGPLTSFNDTVTTERAFYMVVVTP